MKLFKVSDEKLAPEWTFGSNDLNKLALEQISQKDVENLKYDIDDKILARECDKIEKCASSNRTYYYNSQWDSNSIANLHEYALVCGLNNNKFKAINPEEFIEEFHQIEANVNKTQMVKTAKKNQLDLGDPFHIEERSNMEHMKKENWQTVKKSQTLTDNPSMNGTINALRGNEKIDINSDINLANNQNSITNPNAIEQLATSKEIDDGLRLKQENIAKKEKQIKEHSQWEHDVVANMKHLNIVSKGGVFPTESMNASSGLTNSNLNQGIYSSNGPQNLPDKTEGELIAEANLKHKQSISREKINDDRAWENLTKASTRYISDNFTISLEKHLKK